LLAWLQNESGSNVVDEILHQSIISTINWSEVVQKALVNDIDTASIKNDLEALGMTIEPVDTLTAELASYLWIDNKKSGLSLADRICLALGQRKNLTVLTADKAWKKAKTKTTIQLIR
jgi:ribonuclease VapC